MILYAEPFPALPAFLTFSRGVLGTGSHKKDTSLGTMRPGQERRNLKSRSTSCEQRAFMRTDMHHHLLSQRRMRGERPMEAGKPGQLFPPKASFSHSYIIFLSPHNTKNIVISKQQWFETMQNITHKKAALNTKQVFRVHFKASKVKFLCTSLGKQIPQVWSHHQKGPVSCACQCDGSRQPFLKPRAGSGGFKVLQITWFQKV